MGLYAAGDWRLWKDQSAGTLVQEPDFAIRSGGYDASRSVAEYVAELGVNVLIAKPNDAVVTLKDTLPGRSSSARQGEGRAGGA